MFDLINCLLQGWFWFTTLFLLVFCILVCFLYGVVGCLGFLHDFTGDVLFGYSWLCLLFGLRGVFVFAFACCGLLLFMCFGL